MRFLLSISILVALGFASSFGCKPRNNTPTSDVLADGSKSTFLDAEIVDGLLRVPAANDVATIKKKIRAQLSYASGHLEPFFGAADVSRNGIEIVGQKPIQGADGSGWLEVTYKTTLLVAWASEIQQHGVFVFALPSSVEQTNGEEVYLYHSEEFFKKFSEKCIDPKEPGKPAYKFWHYIMPLRAGCPLGPLVSVAPKTSGFTRAEGVDYELVVVTATLKPSTKATTGMKPEYDQIWQDRKLVMLGVFTPFKELDAKDAGVLALQNTMQKLVETYGAATGVGGKKVPASVNFDMSKTWEVLLKEKRNDPYFQLAFSLPGSERTMEFHFILQEDIRGYPNTKDENQSPTWKQLKARMAGVGENVDIFGYFGHSAIGKNIPAFMRLPRYGREQYSIFWLAACTSYMYVDDSVQRINAEVHPVGTAPYKYFDFIATGTVSDFSYWDEDIIPLISGVIGQKQSYREILQQFTDKQRPVVFGEEDNGQPF